uniref:Dolichyl-diphosphooligosaccharide--protein glycosyltransferase subunit DAD1 n=1 Tax=Eptatretus burgeri TaxID=7764 RepID=A0A8C4N874_EPTBU
MAPKFMNVMTNLHKEYSAATPARLKLIDSYLAYVVLTGVIQFVYCCLVGTFPFNSFLSGFISCVGCFVLAGEARDPRRALGSVSILY